MSEHFLLFLNFISVSGRKSPQTDPDFSRQISSERRSSFGHIRRQSSNVMVAKRPLGQIRSPKLVSMMLSSPVTLLTMSVRKGQYTQTKQIIKVSELASNISWYD